MAFDVRLQEDLKDIWILIATARRYVSYPAGSTRDHHMQLMRSRYRDQLTHARNRDLMDRLAGLDIDSDSELDSMFNRLIERAKTEMSISQRNAFRAQRFLKSRLKGSRRR